MKQLRSTSLLVLMLLLAVACASPSPTPPVAPVKIESTAAATATPAPPALTDTATLEPAPFPSATPTSLPPTAQPTPCGPPAGWPAYTIQAGDTLFRIAYNTGTSVDQLKLANCLVGDTIYAGQTLFVPFIPYIPPALPTLPPVPQPVQPQGAVITPELPTAPLPGNPRVDVTPPNGPAGTPFTFAIANFLPNSTVTLNVVSQANGVTEFSTPLVVDTAGHYVFEYTRTLTLTHGSYTVQAVGLPKPAFGEFEITP